MDINKWRERESENESKDLMEDALIISNTV